MVQECVESSQLFLMCTSVQILVKDTLKSVMKNQDVKCSFFKHLFQCFPWMAKVSYLQPLLNILYQNFVSIALKTKFYYFLETRICFVKKKLFNIFLGLCIYCAQKSVKMILENHSLKSFVELHV